MSAIDLSAIKRLDSPRLGEFAAIFERHQNGQARSLQRAIGPSEVGHPCERHLGYKLAGIKPASEEGLKWAALLGTWCHGGAEQAAREENVRLGRERYLVERRAEINDVIVEGGNTDVFDTDALEVVDWKFPGEASSAKSAKDAPVEYVVQLMLYGLGWHRMGHTPRTVRIVFLPRWSNKVSDGHEWVAEWSEAVALDALARLATIQGATNLITGGLAMWTELPADTTKCVFCPWLKRKSPGEVLADENGCHGHHASEEWMGIDPRARAVPTPAEAGRDIKAAWDANGPTRRRELLKLIMSAPTPEALVELWRANQAGDWQSTHTAAAKTRKAELLKNTPGI